MNVTRNVIVEREDTKRKLRNNVVNILDFLLTEAVNSILIQNK